MMLSGAIVETGNALFTYSKHNYYCDVDLNNAKLMVLKITVIEDGEPNNLCYSADKCMKMSVLFKKTILTLFEMKQNGNKLKFRVTSVSSEEEGYSSSELYSLSP